MHAPRAVLVAALVLPLFACGKIKEKIAEKASEKVAETILEKGTGTQVDLGSSSGGVTIKDPKTGAIARAGTGAALPDGWPAAAPVYPGGKIMTSFDTPTGKQVTFTSTDPADKVHAFYKSKLPGKQEAAMDLGDAKMFTTKDGQTTYAAMVSKADEGTTVQLTVSTSK